MRLIDMDAVLLIIEEIKMNKDIPKNYGTLLDIMRSIRRLPIIDAEPVVRCKDCKYHLKHSHGICCNRGFLKGVPKNHYCSYGVKMDEEQG